jgi:hypothetical protein
MASALRAFFIFSVFPLTFPRTPGDAGWSAQVVAVTTERVSFPRRLSDFRDGRSSGGQAER